MAATRMAGVGAVFYAYSSVDAAAYGLSTAAIDADLTKPFGEQIIKIRHETARPESRAGPL